MPVGFAITKFSLRDMGYRVTLNAPQQLLYNGQRWIEVNAHTAKDM